MTHQDHAASHAAFLVAVAFDPRLSYSKGEMNEFVNAAGRVFRYTPEGALPIVEVRNGVASYPDVPRNRQLRDRGIINY